MSKLERYNLSSGNIWEPLRGYSRAVKAGNVLYVSGTTAVDKNGEVIAPGEAYEQTRYVIDKLRDVVDAAGFAWTDVVRTRLFVTNMAKWDEYAQAHREAFEKIRPASSIVQVTRLVDPRLMIEMELEAMLGCELVDSIKVVSRHA